MTALVPVQQTNAEVYRSSTDAAAMCKAMVVSSAMTIQGRKYVKVEGWMAIAVAHGCTGSARDVERVEGGVRAVGEVRRMTDGAVIATAEGFVGEDEATWFGGEVSTYGKAKVLPKRPDYAIRAMAQTRAISRACRSAFAHVIVMMDAGLSTTPAEEVPAGGFDEEPVNVTPARSVHQARKDGGDEKWRAVQGDFHKAETVADLQAAGARHADVIGGFPAGWQREARSLYRERLAELEEAEAALDGAATRTGERGLTDALADVAA